MKKTSKTFRFLLLLIFILTGSFFLFPEFYFDYFNSEEKNESCFSSEIEINHYGPEKEEVIELTNLMRSQHELSPLTENSKLTAAARIKAIEMIEKQYFAHDSPTGQNVKDLAEKVDYHFLIVGENLAKGEFKNSFDLVQGWMNSPDHRKNILEKKYEEIGVAIERGTYNGQELWMAVQLFGTELGVCPQPSEEMALEIDSMREGMDKIMMEIESLDFQIKEEDSIEKQNELIRKRNVLADEYNQLREELQPVINDYNRQIEEREACILNYR